METRRIKKVIKSKPTLEGAGVHLKRALGYSEIPLFDPFLLFDDFRTSDPKLYLNGFPWHPHRGIETITYVLAGKVEHGDSMGNHGVITSGDVQWMTAGGGIIHQEMPKGDNDGMMYGFQLWANLPSTHKMMEPRYQDIKSSQIPEVILDNGVVIKIICGVFNNTKGPADNIIINPVYLDITVPADIEYFHPVNKGHTVFAYIIGGKGYFCQKKETFTYDIEGTNYFDLKRPLYMENEMVVLFEDGDQIYVLTEDESVRFLLISGKPIKEPIAWYGPIVMNTREELQIAFEEYQNGTFIKK